MRNFLPKALVLFSGMIGSAFAQQKPVDLQNCRHGESVEYCTQHKLHEEMMKDPQFAADFKRSGHMLDSIVNEIVMQRQKDKNNGIKPKATVYRIPVVFHVLHDNGPENISRDQILDCIRVWNLDWRGRNPDTANVRAEFKPIIADMEIEFVLATKAPNGAVFSGITRTVSNKTDAAASGSSGNQQVDAIKAGNDVFQGEWPGNKYLNVFVCKEIGGAAGYTYRPANGFTSMKNGIWTLHNYVGSIGTSNLNSSRTLTHEAGHWLDLPHTWGSTNNPGLQSNCNTDDGITDTPNTIGVQACLLNENSCGPLANVENYMDYSYCSKMFTLGQRDRVRAAAISPTGGRNNVISDPNITATGADSNLFLAKAVFQADKRIVCPGTTINFNDESYNKVTGWNWSFPGGTPSTSTVENPSITYNTPGIYEVTLTATDGTNNATTTETNYVQVLGNGVTLPYYESFENYTSLTSANSFFRTENKGGANIWEVFTGAGSSGNKCLRLRNFNQGSGNVDNVISNNFNLSGIPSTGKVTFSFKYAYRKVSSANNEILRFSASGNCGELFTVRKTISNTGLSSQTSTSEWTPTAQDWVQVHVVNVTSQFFTSNMQAQLQFESAGGNNIYVDDINFYQGEPSGVGLNELSDVSEISLYPNPVDEELNVSFNVATAGSVVIEVKDLTGKTIGTHLIDASEGDNLIMFNTSDFASGMYLMNLKSKNSQKTIQFVVK